MPLVTARAPSHNPPVLFNNGTGIGLPNTQADDRHHGGIFSSVIHALRVSFMAGECGASSRMAGSCVPVGQPCILPATPIGLGVAGSSAHTGDIAMSSTITHVQNTPTSAAPTPALKSPWPESANKALARHSSAGKEYEFFGDAYSVGCFEGETAFALAATAALPGDVVSRCKHMALVKLGLNDPACVATENLRGWLCAVFESLGDAVDELAITKAADSQYSPLIAASRELAQHIEAGSFSVGPETTLEACAALERFQMAVEGGADERAL